MEELAVITALNYSASFGNNCVEFKEKKNVIHQPMSVRYRKKCALCLEYCPQQISSNKLSRRSISTYTFTKSIVQCLG